MTNPTNAEINALRRTIRLIEAKEYSSEKMREIYFLLQSPKDDLEKLITDVANGEEWVTDIERSAVKVFIWNGTQERRAKKRFGELE